MSKSNKKHLENGRIVPPMSMEDMENEMIHLAMQRAREQLMDGTASSQIITHFCKLGSTRERIEQRGKEIENDLMAAKRDSIEQNMRTEEDFHAAIEAFTKYRGDD